MELFQIMHTGGSLSKFTECSTRMDESSTLPVRLKCMCLLYYSLAISFIHVTVAPIQLYALLCN